MSDVETKSKIEQPLANGDEAIPATIVKNGSPSTPTKLNNPSSPAKSDDSLSSGESNSSKHSPKSDTSETTAVAETPESPETDETTPDANVERSPDYHKLIEYGLDEKVSARLDEIYTTGTGT
jgi:hypothetical protein